jgi:hypothetical protein
MIPELVDLCFSGLESFCRNLQKIAEKIARKIQKIHFRSDNLGSISRQRYQLALYQFSDESHLQRFLSWKSSTYGRKGGGLGNLEADHNLADAKRKWFNSVLFFYFFKYVDFFLPKKNRHPSGGNFQKYNGLKN